MTTPSTEPAMIPAFSGLLFIGDPHVSSKRPGRRKDDYLASVLGKLEACAELCHASNLRPVILGDLLHVHDDNSLRMVNRLMRVLKKFPVPPLTLDGNHDRDGAEIDDDDALQVLVESKVVVVPTPGLAETLFVQGKVVEVWAAPYGSAIPNRLTSSEKSATRVLLTHHDLAFGSSYPGALPLKAIDGCSMAVNGHMHDTKPSETRGSTVWHNPGNIEPLSVDLKDHKPAAWVWNPTMGPEALTPYYLPHGADIFDMTGLQVDAAPAAAAVAALDALQSQAPAAPLGRFATELLSQGGTEALRTDDASVLRQDADQVLDARGASEPVRQLLAVLLDKVSSAAAQA